MERLNQFIKFTQRVTFAGMLLIQPVEAFAQDVPIPTPDQSAQPQPWECDVAAHECTGDNIRAAIEFVSQDQSISARFLTCLVQAESQFDPYNISRTNDHGPVQFHLNPADRYHSQPWTLMDTTPWAGNSVYDPLPSVSAAAWLINRGVTDIAHSGWSTYPQCAHLR
jgi:hypothetical protein